MAFIQRMIKSGIRLNNYNPRAITPINRLGALANPYRSISSGSCGDGHLIRAFNVDTYAMVNALKSEGVRPEDAKTITCSITKFLAENEKDPAHSSTLLKSTLKNLRKTATDTHFNLWLGKELEALTMNQKLFNTGFGVMCVLELLVIGYVIIQKEKQKKEN